MPRSVVVVLLLVCVGAWPEGCARQAVTPLEQVENAGTLFIRLPAAYTGIDFENRLRDTQSFNVFTYRNYHNGGGVGIGDVNGDGLADLFLTANQLPNRLFLNQGDFRFRDVTRQARVQGTHPWSTGVSLADVNGDGLLDIYVCNAGRPADDRANELFINQGPEEDGVPVFKEMAAAYGLDDGGYATHATFFDYDRDGDLDLYLLNNSPRPVSSFGLENSRHVRHNGGGDKLFRNEGGRFIDVSEEAGIYGSEMAFGLGVTTGDVNNDGWPDLYISNDFFERDYLYLNNGNSGSSPGQAPTFTDTLEAAMPVISLSSMGADLADINNDGFSEIYVTDMLPEDDDRLKTTSTYESWAAYQRNVAHGYHHQFMRNTLHLNNADGTFSEIGQMAGVSATDWSWGALFADFDLDGYKDLFVSNGVLRDVTNQDYIDVLADRRTAESVLHGEQVDFLALIEKAPSNPLPNYAFRNNGDLTFTNQAVAWGLDDASFSNGAAYGDLDNDGDLDLVVNNVNEELFVYRNDADLLLDAHYLQVALSGEGQNRYGLGAKVTARHGEQVFTLEQMPLRGFQSSVDPVLTIGLGSIDTVETVTVTWPEGRVQTLHDVPANQRLIVRQADAAPVQDYAAAGVSEPAQPLFADVTDVLGLQAGHTENKFVDFDREQLYPKMISTEGPPLAVADVNGDGLDDFYLGGAKEAPGQLFVQQRAGGFTPVSTDVFSRDAISEDVGAAFFDADGDGDQDLYVVSGGNEFSGMAPALLDRLYLNDGRGAFEKASGRLPALYQSGSCARPSDVDGDDDLDLFVGGRIVPWRYGESPDSYLLENDGTGHFTDATERLAPGLTTPGMITDAAWIDMDGDRRDDLVIVGEWMPVTVFRNAGGRLEPHEAGLDTTHGLWNRLLAGDLDGDGDADLVAGNWGLNSKFRASQDAPLTMHVHDFGRNGSVEQIVSIPQQGTPYPMVLRHELLRSLPFLQTRLPTHAAYAGKTVQDVFTAEELQGATVHVAYTLHSAYFENQGAGTFTMHALPAAAQRAPLYGLLAGDFDLDGHTDLLLGGNFYAVAPSIGRLDASYGLFLKGYGASTFEPVPSHRSGFHLPGQVRDMKIVRDAAGRRLVIAAKNDAPVQLLQAMLGQHSL